MYFDCVVNIKAEPVFNGTPNEVKEWLLENEDLGEFKVVVGQTLAFVSVNEYLGRK